MKGNPRVIAHLQRLLNAQLLAADLSLAHARALEDRGLERLAARIDEMVQQARDDLDRLLRRMLFLGASPDMNQRDRIAPATDTAEMLRAELNTQYHLAECLREAIACCHGEHDYQTGALLLSILAPVEERHAYWLEQQLGLLENLGEPVYLTTQMR